MTHSLPTATSLDQLSSMSIEERRKMYIPEEISTAYPITDNGEGFMSIKEYAAQYNAPIHLAPISEQAAQYMHLRASVCETLAAAANLIQERSQGRMMLAITDAFRPLELQKKYFEEITEEIQEKEGLEGAALYNRVTEFIADPELCPPHSTGATVDCTLVYSEAKEQVEMGSNVDEISDKANTWHPEVVGEERENRDLLHDAMVDAGFVNLTSEWWHYSCGDQYWAIVMGEEAAKYGSKESLE